MICFITTAAAATAAMTTDKRMWVMNTTSHRYHYQLTNTRKSSPGLTRAWCHHLRWIAVLDHVTYQLCLHLQACTWPGTTCLSSLAGRRHTKTLTSPLCPSISNVPWFRLTTYEGRSFVCAAAVEHWFTHCSVTVLCSETPQAMQLRCHAIRIYTFLIYYHHNTVSSWIDTVSEFWGVNRHTAWCGLAVQTGAHLRAAETEVVVVVVRLSNCWWITSHCLSVTVCWCSSYDLNTLLQQQTLNESYEKSAAYLRYTQEATEVIKNAVGVCYESWYLFLCSDQTQSCWEQQTVLFTSNCGK